MKRDFPKMPECTNCGDCCGPVTARPSEVEKIKRYVERKGIEWIPLDDDPLKCGFYQRGLCAIYPVRPSACRMFGVVKEMPCSFFPQAARMSFPPKAAIASGLMALNDPLLSEHFAADGGLAMEAARILMVQASIENAEPEALEDFRQGKRFTPMNGEVEFEVTPEMINRALDEAERRILARRKARGQD